MRRPLLALTSLALLMGIGCGSASVVQCRVAAVTLLPEDPMQLTVFDTFELIERLKACDAAPAADAGKP